MAKNSAKKTSAIGLTVVVLVGLIVVFAVPVTPQGTIFNMLTSEQTKEEPVACIQIFAPVCGADGVTYDNSCIAENVGKTTVVHEGMCEGEEGLIMSDEPSFFCQVYPTASGCN